MSFPFDWIKPGEQRFCSKCGVHRIHVTDSLCLKCKRVSTQAAIRLHRTLTLAIEELATQRRNEGLNPLFWMEGTK